MSKASKLASTERYSVALLKEFDGNLDLVEKIISFQEQWGTRRPWHVREALEQITNQPLQPSQTAKEVNRI